MYQSCLACELRHRGLAFQQQVSIPVAYRGELIECGYRADFVIERVLLIELKSIERTLPVHQAQVLTYLTLLNLRQGLLLNFNVVRLVDGLTNLLL